MFVISKIIDDILDTLQYIIILTVAWTHLHWIIQHQVDNQYLGARKHPYRKGLHQIGCFPEHYKSQPKLSNQSGAGVAEECVC